MGITRSSKLKPYTFDRVEVGEELGPVAGVVSELKVAQHAFAVDDHGSWYFHSSPFGGRIGHPTLLATDVLMLVALLYDVVTPPCEAGLHARNELEFLKPVFLGQKVTIRGTHVEKYKKRAQSYRILDGVVADEGGQPLVRMRATETIGLTPSTPVGQGMSAPPPDAVSGDIPVGAPTVHRASRWVPEGAALPMLVKRTTLEQSTAYSGYPFGWVEGGATSMWVNQHTDPELAQQHGHPDAVIQGLCSAAYISEMCVNFFGPPWLTTGRLVTTFLRPVIIRDMITVGGVVKRYEEQDGGAGRRLWLDVWCKNQQGELATVGRASAAVE
jgi:acyl dehydratase